MFPLCSHTNNWNQDAALAAREKNVEGFVVRYLPVFRERRGNILLVGKPLVGNEIERAAALQRPCRDGNELAADARLGRASLMEGRVHEDGVVALFDRFSEQVAPEEPG